MRRLSLAAAALHLVLGTSLAGQTVDAGALSGTVIDESTGQPVHGARVTLQISGSGLLIAPEAADVAVIAKSVLTGHLGAYRFAPVAPGNYLLRVERLGYRSRSVEVEVLRPIDARLSVGLAVSPVPLEPIFARQVAASLFQRSMNRASEEEEARRSSERARQELYITPDARVITYADVMDGVTLGEGDIFRALHRLPGVATRDDYTAEMWTRGSPWSHTQVTFDGVPLFNPLHAIGVLSAITPEVLGAVFFHPGVRPAAIAGGAAGVVDLRTRPGTGSGPAAGAVDLSMASSKLLLTQDLGNVSWVAAARRSNLGLLGGGMEWLGLDTLDLPFAFHDVVGRVDVPLGESFAVEASGIFEGDRLHGDVDGIIERNRASWGSTAGRVTVRGRTRSLAIETGLGGSRFAARTDTYRVRTRPPIDAWTEPPSRNSLENTRLAAEIHPLSGTTPPWKIGYDVTWQGGEYDGPLPRYFAVRPARQDRLHRVGDLAVAAIWGEARVQAMPGLTINPGVRVEAGGGTLQNAGPIRPAPRVAVRYNLSADHALSLAIGRSWQYGQAIALAGPSIHPAFHATQFWVWADEQTPALRSDIASIGSELWLGDGWLGSLTGYVRRTSGMAVPDPTPGPIGDRPLFVTATNTARGAEASVRRIGNRWSTSVGYALGFSRVAALRHVFPAPAERRHMLDAMAAVRLLPPLRVAVAYTTMSGAPFTRSYTRAPGDCSFFGFECGSTASYVEAPNAERTDAYASFDASAQWTRQIGSIETSLYAQVRNVLNRTNESTYAGTVAIGRTTGRDGQRRIIWEDRFESGLPRLLLVGARVSF
jgi:hypothetical protein